MVMKKEYCTCALHYVCYGGPICMNSGCGKPHQYYMDVKKGWIKTPFKYIKNPSAYLAYTLNEKTGVKTPAWSQMDGSISGDCAYRHRYDDKLNKKWWEFWK